MAKLLINTNDVHSLARSFDCTITAEEYRWRITATSTDISP